MGNSHSSERELFEQVLCTLLRGRGVTTSKGQIHRFVDFVQQVCPWFPIEGTININTWRKIGESIDGFSPERQIFPVLQRQNDQGQQWRDYEPIPYKTLKELKLACAQYGAMAPFTIATMETIASLALPPQDWKTMCKAVLTGGDYLLWLAEYHESCERQARSEVARRLGIT